MFHKSGTELGTRDKSTKSLWSLPSRLRAGRLQLLGWVLSIPYFCNLVLFFKQKQTNSLIVCSCLYNIRTQELLQSPQLQNTSPAWEKNASICICARYKDNRPWQTLGQESMKRSRINTTKPGEQVNGSQQRMTEASGKWALRPGDMAQ